MGWSAGTFTRTDGTRTGTEVWQEAEAAGVDIISSDHDVHDQDLASGINDCLKKDGGNSPSANIDWSNNRITNYGAPSARSDAARVAEVQDSAHMWGGTAGGTADALTVSLSPSISSYTTGLVVWFIASAANTGSATLNVDSVGATTLKKTDGTTDLAAGDIVSGRLYGALYDGTNFQVLNLDVPAGTVDTASLADDAVTNAKIADDAVDTAQIADSAVNTARIADDAVTRAKIADAAMSGADATLVTGTAGTDGNLAQWNADGDLVDGPSPPQSATRTAEGLVEEATEAEVYASTNGKFLDAGHLDTAVAAAGALSDGTTISVDWSAFVFDRVTIAGNRTLDNPTNEQQGQWRMIEVDGNDGTNRTLSFGSEYEVAPTLDDITSTNSYVVSIFCLGPGRFRAYADEGGDPT